MPKVGVPNNPSGANSWQGFGTEEPYGQKTQDASLARAAPMAGAKVASGPIAAPKRAGRRAARGKATQVAPVGPPVPAVPPTLSPDARLAQWWQGIAAIPGASPLILEYAATVRGRVLLPAAWGPHPGSGAKVGGKAGQGQSGLPKA